MFKIREPVSLVDRTFYSERLRRLLICPLLDDMKIAYQLSYTEATDRNLKDILKYIDNKNYFKLSRLKNRLSYIQDEFGETSSANLYEIYWLKDKQNNYYLACIYVQLVDEYAEKLVVINKVKYFPALFICNKRLIYPVKIK